VLRAATASAAVVAGLLASRFGVRSPGTADLPVASYNDNLHPAGTRSGNVLRVSLEARLADWRPLGKDREGTIVPMFAESGNPVQIPGPMLRVPLGTELRATVTNRLDFKLEVHGLYSRRTIPEKTLVLEPGQTAEVRFPADAEGTYFYWAGKAGTPFDERVFDDSQLNGALIVDPPGGRTDDRVFLISQMLFPDSAGTPDGREFLTINGRPWPLTERLNYTVGDSVRWRWINASENNHPLHLHGFYYRIESRGDAARDTIYWPGQQRMAVTELLDPQQTMRLVWSPDRPGGWIFHCHLTFHIIPNPPLGNDKALLQQYIAQFTPDVVHEPAHHVERAMGGLMLAMYVKPKAPLPAAVVPQRTLRLFVQAGKLPGDTTRHFSYVLEQGAEPAADSVAPWAPVIVLHRGEPTGIWVINRSLQPTAVHWHGLEIQSPFDGVVGVGGYAGSPAPPIMPGDSFLVRVTPPRSGSFMYHTHMSEIFQQAGGLWGPLLVLDPGASWDREHDFVFQAGPSSADVPWLNGRLRQDTLRLRAATTYRFRLMNVTMGNPAIQFWLVREGGTPVGWTQLARDGFELPSWQRSRQPARLHVGIGETKDVEVRFGRPGNVALEMRGGAGNLFISQPIVVMAADSLKR
jgi:FtsP/CotA-like multicopper oxidase with cupredoxin domain